MILLSHPAATIEEPQHRAYGGQGCLHNCPWDNKTGEQRKLLLMYNNKNNVFILWRQTSDLSVS